MPSQALAKSARERLILALDADTLDEALRLIDELREFVGVFKVGLQLFCNLGPSLFETLHAENISVFFDGKFLDIPNTVAGATRAIVSRSVEMFNVHATGGSAMLRATVEACEEICRQAGVRRPKVLGVTVLTSLGPAVLRDELGLAASLEEQVCRLALLAQRCRLDGVVASAWELCRLREACGPGFLLVTPGVRPTWSAADDQSRIVTPAQAIKDGADYLVVGRPITAAKDRRDAARRIVAEMQEALG